MLISHETPISLLKESLSYNDYDYCLVHLCETMPEYYDFFKQSLKKGRHVLLDNSIFELGTSFDPVKYAKYIEDLRPTEYIIPDVLEDADGTCASMEAWMKDYKDLPGKKIAVVQGKNYEDIKRCLAYIASDKSIHKIGISFDYKCYLDLCPKMPDEVNKWVRFSLGRNLLLEKLEGECMLPRNKKYHLLGCSLPQEFKYAKKFDFMKHMFESVDTSNPVVHGIYNIRYHEKLGLSEKNSMKLCDLIKTKTTKKQLANIKYNAKIFKQFINQGYAV